jgi:hypothetical protein
MMVSWYHQSQIKAEEVHQISNGQIASIMQKINVVYVINGLCLPTASVLDPQWSQWSSGSGAGS